MGYGITRRATLPAFLAGVLGIAARGKAASLPTDPIADCLFVDLGQRVIPADISMVTSTGYKSVGYGAARYVATEVEGETRYRFRSANRRWFELAEQFPDTFMFGGVGDDSADDTLALQAQHDFCAARKIPVLVPVPPVAWRTTKTIVSTARAWSGLGERTAWHFDPPSSEAEDMQACLRLVGSECRLVEHFEFRGPHGYTLRDYKSYIADASKRFWYHEWLKKGCSAIFISDLNQPTLRGISTFPGSFKVDVCVDVVNGHVEFGEGCKFYGLIGCRIIRNSDDFKWLSEVGIAPILIGILFGTSGLGGSVNGGLGVRKLEAYIGSCPYGILQLYDHGREGAPLANPAIRIAGIYGNLNNVFFEFIGEAAIQTLPEAVVMDLDFQDMFRFGWDKNFTLPVEVLPADRAQAAAFHFGQFGRNNKLGTVRAQPIYRCSFTANPEAFGVRIAFSDGDPTSVLARSVLAETNIVRRSAHAHLLDLDGRQLHEGNALQLRDISMQGNLFGDPYDVERWTGSAVDVLPISNSDAAFPWPMLAEIGWSDQPALRFNDEGKRTLVVDRKPSADAPFFMSFWCFVTKGALIVHVSTNGRAGKFIHHDTTLPAEVFQGHWRRFVFADVPLPAGELHVDMIIREGPVFVAGLMGSFGQFYPFSRSLLPGSSKLFRASGGLEIKGSLLLNDLSTPLPAGEVPAISGEQPAGYVAVIIDGVARRIPYY